MQKNSILLAPLPLGYSCSLSLVMMIMMITAGSWTRPGVLAVASEAGCCCCYKRNSVPVRDARTRWYNTLERGRNNNPSGQKAGYEATQEPAAEQPAGGLLRRFHRKSYPLDSKRVMLLAIRHTPEVLHGRWLHNRNISTHAHSSQDEGIVLASISFVYTRRISLLFCSRGEIL